MSTQTRWTSQVSPENIGEIHQIAQQMFASHNGNVRVTWFTSDPDVRKTDLPIEWKVKLHSTNEYVTLGRNQAMQARAGASSVLLELAEKAGRRVITSNLRGVEFFTPYQVPYTSQDMLAYCYAIFNPGSIRIERLHFAPPNEGVRNSCRPYWCVTEVSFS